MPRVRLSQLLVATFGLGIVALSFPAEAHLLDATGAGWGSGFAHPFSGLDHLLAMIAVGIWAAQIGRPALWLLPLAFPTAMAVGGAMGASGIEVPFIEAGIASSVAVLGLLIALAVRPPAAVAAMLVIVFALFHGHAHGTELPEAASPWLYGIGFVLATAILHAVGLGLGALLNTPFGARSVRLGGLCIATFGVLLLLGSV